MLYASNGIFAYLSWIYVPLAKQNETSDTDSENEEKISNEETKEKSD